MNNGYASFTDYMTAQSAPHQHQQHQFLRSVFSPPPGEQSLPLYDEYRLFNYTESEADMMEDVDGMISMAAAASSARARTDDRPPTPADADVPTISISPASLHAETPDTLEPTSTHAPSLPRHPPRRRAKTVSFAAQPQVRHLPYVNPSTLLSSFVPTPLPSAPLISSSHVSTSTLASSYGSSVPESVLTSAMEDDQQRKQEIANAEAEAEVVAMALAAADFGQHYAEQQRLLMSAPPASGRRNTVSAPPTPPPAVDYVNVDGEQAEAPADEIVLERRRARLHSIPADLSIAVVSDEQGVTQYKCLINGCGKMFGRLYNCRAHVRTHSGERPWACTEPDCGARFVRKHDLTRHMLVHSGERRFQCDECGKTFARQDALLRHTKGGTVVAADGSMVAGHISDRSTTTMTMTTTTRHRRRTITGTGTSYAQYHPEQ
jgi:uncharacterized C2H2 Zn-finger protein